MSKSDSLQNIENCFKPSSKTVFDLLSENGTFFVIPTYQRPYSWKKEEISKMLNDIFEGYFLLLTKVDTIKFLGTILTTDSRNSAEVGEQKSTELPSRVLAVIDGQQRITTLILILTSLYEKIVFLHNKWKDSIQKQIDKAPTNLKKGSEEELQESNDLIEELREAMEEVDVIVGRITTDIDSCVNELMGKKKSPMDTQYYPRIIRLMDDYWDKDRSGSYTSAIASYIYNCMRYYRKLDEGITPQKDETFSISAWVANAKDDQKEFYAKLEDALKVIREAFSVFEKTSGSSNSENYEDENKDCKEENELYIAPKIKFLIEPKVEGVLKALFLLNTLSDPAVQQLHGTSKNSEELRKLLQFSALAGYLMYRVAITSVNASNEDMAFDIFESLNTAGSPLTAIETFKPHVFLPGLRKEDILYRRMQDITTYLQDKDADASKLIQVFAFAEAGRTKLTRINQQRIFLNQYDKFDDSQKEKFIENLFHTKEFLECCWGSKLKISRIADFITREEREELEFCLAFLKSIKHVRALGPIVRFFSHWRDSVGDSSNDLGAKEEAASDFVAAVKACTAFTVLWRTAFGGGTNGVDNEYAKVMIGTISQDYPPFYHQNIKHQEIELPAVSDLKGVFIAALQQEKIGSTEQWVDKVKTTNYQPGFRKLAIVVLLAAANDAEASTNYPYTLVKGKEGCNPLIRAELFNALTLEHISPQDRGKGSWNDSFHNETYSSAKLVDSLGNYTLLPLPENSFVSNKDWEEKKRAYKVFASGRLPADVSGLTKEEKEKFEKYYQFLSWLKPIADQPHWGPDKIKERTEEIARLAHKTLYNWLI